MFFTYSAHPLACAMADKVLEIMEREHLVEHAAEIGARLGAQLKEELSGHPLVGDIRGTGLFWGIELVRDQASRTPYPPELRLTNRVLAAAMKHDLFRLSVDRDGRSHLGRRRRDGHAAARDWSAGGRIHSA